MANIGDYERTYADFDWETPERFNFGRDVVDRWAAQDRAAMIWLGTSGEERRLDFAQFSVLSNRFANAARALGVGRGDRVMVLLGKVPEWHAILTGLLKVGAIAIPCAPQLRAGDLKFRAEHSGSVAMISGHEGIEEVEKMREDVPVLEHFISLGTERAGWEAYEKLVEGASEDFTAEDTTADEGAFILYTSGTTKHPKGALHTHAYTHAKWMEARYWLDLREGLGQEHLERISGAVEPGNRDLLPRGRFRPRRTPTADGTLRHFGPLPGPDRVPAPRQDAGTGTGEPRLYPPRRLRRRTAEPARHRAVERASRPDHLRRLRADREHPARRQLSRPRLTTRLDGQTVSWLRCEGRRPRR